MRGADPSGGESVFSSQDELNLLVLSQNDKDVQRMKAVERGGGCNTHMKSHSTSALLVGRITGSDSSNKQCS